MAKPKKEIRKYQGGDKAFIMACELAQTPATHRQYRKWANSYGKAFSHKNEALNVANA